MQQNTRDFVIGVLGALEAAGIKALLGGGWAEEFHGLAKPRPHKDVDLYYVAKNFSKVDEFIKTNGTQEIEEKRFPHKRAFLVDGVMVEVVLIRQDSAGYYSRFWGEKEIRWPSNVSESAGGVNCLSWEALSYYRSVHNELFAS